MISLFCRLIQYKIVFFKYIFCLILVHILVVFSAYFRVEKFLLKLYFILSAVKKILANSRFVDFLEPKNMMPLPPLRSWSTYVTVFNLFANFYPECSSYYGVWQPIPDSFTKCTQTRQLALLQIGRSCFYDATNFINLIVVVSMSVTFMGM